MNWQDRQLCIYPVVACFDELKKSHFANNADGLNRCGVVTVDRSQLSEIPDCSESLSLRDALLSIDVEY